MNKEMETLADKICKEELKQEPSDENLAFRKTLVHGMVRWQEETKALNKADVSGSLLQSLHQDLKGFQEMGFLTPDAKMGLGIAIEQVERYMRGELEARQQ